MKIIDRMTQRLFALLGLDFDYDFTMQREHFNQITDNLTLGARPSPQHIPALQKDGITHVVSCLEPDERPKMTFLESDFETLFLSVDDVVNADIAATFPTLFDFADQALQVNPEAKLLVHCQAGVSRSATLTIAYLMMQERKRFFETYRDVRAKRVRILPNIGFASQLQQFEHQYRPASQTSDELSSLAQYLHQICNAPVDIDLLQTMLVEHDYDAYAAIHAIFGDIPRVIQGVRF